MQDLPANGGMGGTEQEWLDAVAEYERVVKKHNIPLGGFVLGEGDMMKNMAKGKSFLVCSADVMELAALPGDLAKARATVPLMSQSTAGAANGTPAANGQAATNGHSRTGSVGKGHARTASKEKVLRA